MTVEELMKELRAIVKVHPEAKDAQIVTAIGADLGYPSYVGFDKRHKPARLRLED